MNELGFIIGCIVSEKYYTFNIQRTAIFIAYLLSICSSLSLYFLFLHGSNTLIVIGYTLSGIGQALLMVVIVTYTIPIIKNNPFCPVLPIVFCLLGVSGVLGSVLNIFLYDKNEASNYSLLGLNSVFIIISFIISWDLKGITKSSIITDNNKPIIPFEDFNIVFYAFGVT
jgi:MFS family permease